MFYRTLRIFILFTAKLFFRLKIVNWDHVPKNGVYILACNHISYLDPVMAGVVGKQPISYMAKDSLFDHFFLGALIRKLGAFPVKRNTADFRAIREAFRSLSHGRPMLIFPEGTRKRDAKGSQINAGVGMLAARSGAPVIPVYMEGTDKVLPPGAKFLRFRPITIYVGEPKSYSKDQPYEGIAGDIMARINALSPSAGA